MLPQHLQLSLSSSEKYLLDHIRTMRSQETTWYKVSRDYFNDVATECMSSTGFVVTPSERKTMLTWAYDIVDVCKIERNVAISAVSYLDRFLANNVDHCIRALSSRRDYQLCFIVCLIVALKNCAGMKVESEFVTNVLCHGLYHEKEILEMEMVVLKGLGWRLNGPTAIDFVHAFLRLLPNQDESKMKSLIKRAEHQVELAMGDFSISLQEPSSIACSSIVIAMNSLYGMCCSTVEVNSLDRFVWMKSIAMSAGLDIGGLMMRMTPSTHVGKSSASTVVSCSDSSVSTHESSPRTSFCGIDEFNDMYSTQRSYFTRNTQ